MLRNIIYKLWHYFPRLISRYLKYLIYDLAFRGNVQKWMPDAIHAHDLATLPCAIKAAHGTGIPVIYDSHEMEQYRNPPLTNFQRKWVRFLERKYGRLSNQVITVSQPIAKFLAKELNKESVKVIYNSPTLSHSRHGRKLREDCNIEGNVPLAVFVGGVFINRGIENLTEALKHLPEFHLALVGPQNKEVVFNLSKHVENAGVKSRWHLLPPVPPNHVVHYIRDADIGVYAIPNVARSYDYCMPNKLFEMSLAGLPIAASNLNATSHFLKKIGNGLIFDETDPRSIAEVMQAVYNQREQLGMNESSVDEFFKDYGWPAQESKLIKIYQELL